MAEQLTGSMSDIYTPLGSSFTPSMLLAHYTPDQGWHNCELGPRRPLELDPATMGLHYGQAAFEGLKAYRQTDGSWALFRAYDHARRLAQSCERMAIPPIPAELCVAWWRDFCRLEVSHLGQDDNASLYLRPLVFASDASLGARPSHEYLLLILGIAAPGPAAERQKIEVLITTDYVRAAPGGVGAAKTPGNYGASMLALKVAQEQGCDQVLWLDAGRRRWIEELGSMNVGFVIADTVVTPLVTDTILAGVTRDTVLTLARENGIDCEERPVVLEEVTAAMSWKGLTEAFACSTGAGMTGIAGFRIGPNHLVLPEPSPISDRIRGLLADAVHGHAADLHGWRTAI